jgi:hypothetical protein
MLLAKPEARMCAPRALALVMSTALLAAGPAWAQEPGGAHPYQLDPYKPSHAALLRLGGALPVWFVWSEWPVTAPFPQAPPFGDRRPRHLREHADARADRRVDEPAMSTTPPSPTAIATLRRPESNDGVWIEFDGRRWLADGRAVPFVEGRFTRVGERGGHPVYRETAGVSERIFIATADDLVAPFRPR